MSNPPANLPMAFELHAEPHMSAGVYANSLAIWHTPHEFTLDFMVNAQPPQPAQTEEGMTVVRTPYQLVARVRVPPGAVFDVLRALNENMTRYEQAFGPIRRPGDDQPLYPPSAMGNTDNEPPQQ